MNESLGEEFIEACTKGDVETVQTLAKGETATSIMLINMVRMVLWRHVAMVIKI